LSVKDSDPLKLPVPAGANFSVSLQLAPGARLDVLGGQPLVIRVNPVPLTAMPVKVTLYEGKRPPLRLVIVTVCVVLVPWGMEPKLTGSGLAPTAVPTPVRLTLCGLALALSVTVSVPARVLMSFGEKLTLIEQLDPEVRVVPQVLVEME